MSTEEPTLDDPSAVGWTAFVLTGMFLLAFVLGFARFLAGSWREAGALAVAALGYLAGVLLLGRLFPARTVAQWRRLAAGLPILGACVGAAYVAVSSATGVRPIITGIVVGATHSWLTIWQAGRRGSGASAPAP
jgi:hypothetical protein